MAPAFQWDRDQIATAVGCEGLQRRQTVRILIKWPEQYIFGMNNSCCGFSNVTKTKFVSLFKRLHPSALGKRNQEVYLQYYAYQFSEWVVVSRIWVDDDAVLQSCTAFGEMPPELTRPHAEICPYRHPHFTLFTLLLQWLPSTNATRYAWELAILVPLWHRHHAWHNL